jgi:glycosyltransferase involved in cell wall biosynthesis
VVVAWDGQHAEWAGEALDSIWAQHPQPSERVLVIDNPAGLGLLSRLAGDPRNRGWTVLHGAWGDPAAARNLGFAHTRSGWVVFFDADNVMAPGYVDAVCRAARSARPQVGILYPDIQYVGADLSGSGVWRVPDYDYWSLRGSNFIDTSSAWRREAVELAGCWPAGGGGFQDYALALEITRRGWTAQRREGPPVTMRLHEQRRLLAY